MFLKKKEYNPEYDKHEYEWKIMGKFMEQDKVQELQRQRMLHQQQMMRAVQVQDPTRMATLRAPVLLDTQQEQHERRRFNEIDRRRAEKKKQRGISKGIHAIYRFFGG